MAEWPIIEAEKCDGCGLCVVVCSRHSLVVVDNVVTALEIDECDYCAWCEAVCPTGAISCPFEIVFEE